MKKGVLIVFILFALAVGHGKEYKGAELRTREGYIYGRFEVSYKPPRGSGMLASFFTYHDFTTSSKEWNEIDFEVLGRYDHDVQVTSIGPGQKFRNSHQYVPFNTHEDFHVYAFEWTPAYIAWFIDGVEVYRQDQEHIQQFVFPQKIMMNIWNPEWKPWAGEFDPRILPLFAYYDWVAYYQYTPGSGHAGTDHNFTLLWRDDFDFWDQQRWEKATHTWGGNGCDFVEENAVFKDGKLILCLTTASQLGYLDRTPPSVLWARANPYTQKIEVYFSEDVEKASAETVSHYNIAGVVVDSAVLQEDRRTVLLSVNGLEAQRSYNLIVMSIKDRWFIPNRLTGQVVLVHQVQPLTLPVKINVGGGRFADYLPDQDWGPLVEYGHMDGYAEKYADALEIANTEEDSLYRTELHEVVFYNVRVPAGKYRVTLKIAENNFREEGKRLFDIRVQGMPIAKKLDLIKTVGPNTAYELTASPVEVTDGLLSIHFCNLWSFSLLNGLVIEPLTSGVEETKPSLPQEATLQQNFPNPFNHSTQVLYFLPAAGMVDLAVYDIHGRRLATVQRDFVSAGEHRLTWQSQLPSGVYFIRLDVDSKSGHYHKALKMIVLK